MSVLEQLRLQQAGQTARDVSAHVVVPGKAAYSTSVVFPLGGLSVTTSVQLNITNRIFSKTAEKVTFFEVRIVIYVKNGV